MIELDGTGNEAHVTALLDQPSDPPVVVELFLQTRNNVCIRDCASCGRPHRRCTYFDVQEIFALEGDGISMDGRVLVDPTIVRHVRPHGKGDRLVLNADWVVLGGSVGFICINAR